PREKGKGKRKKWGGRTFGLQPFCFSRSYVIRMCAVCAARGSAAQASDGGRADGSAESAGSRDSDDERSLQCEGERRDHSYCVEGRGGAVLSPSECHASAWIHR